MGTTGQLPEKEREMVAEAEALGVPFVCVDDRPIPPGVRHSALMAQAYGFESVLHQHGVPPVRVNEDGTISLVKGADVHTYSVHEMRDLLHKLGSGERFAAALLWVRAVLP